jgi:hypothetical protein
MQKIKIILIIMFFTIFVYGQIQKKIEVVKKPKSPKKALMMSAVLPGVGQFYSKSKLSGIVYGTLEIAGITSAILLKNNGEDKVNEYEDYADINWALLNFMEGYDGEPRSHDMIVVLDGKRYSVSGEWGTLYDDFNNGYNSISVEKDYHFYENIGKYEQFQTGWIDYGDSLGYETLYRSSPLQDKYSDMRFDANQLLKGATYAVSAVMFNHVISAIDAAIRTKKYNDRNNLSFKINAVPMIYKDKGAIVNMQFCW